jgi:hypothetical protein
MAAALCQHVYDVMGCEWNMPGDYDAGFGTCQADSGEVCLTFLPAHLSQTNHPDLRSSQAHGCIRHLNLLPRSASDASRPSGTLFLFLHHLKHDRKWFPDLRYQHRPSKCYPQCCSGGKHSPVYLRSLSQTHLPSRSPHRA